MLYVVIVNDGGFSHRVSKPVVTIGETLNAAGALAGKALVLFWSRRWLPRRGVDGVVGMGGECDVSMCRRPSSCHTIVVAVVARGCEKPARVDEGDTTVDVLACAYACSGRDGEDEASWLRACVTRRRVTMSRRAHDMGNTCSRVAAAASSWHGRCGPNEGEVRCEDVRGNAGVVTVCASVRAGVPVLTPVHGAR